MIPPKVRKFVTKGGVHSLILRFCRADLGGILKFSPANFRNIAGEFLGESLQRIYSANFSALFLQGFKDPPQKKNHTQIFLSSFPISETEMFHADLLLLGETNTQRQRDDKKNQFCIFEFGAGGDREGNRAKRCFFSPGKRHDNKF